MRQMSDHLLQSEDDSSNQGDAASDSNCSSNSAPSDGDGDSTVVPDVWPARTSNGIAATARAPTRGSVYHEEVCDLEGEEEKEERDEEGGEERDEEGGEKGEEGKMKSKRHGEKKTFLSGETVENARKVHTSDLSRPPLRNLNARLGVDGRDGWTPTPEVQVTNRRMSRHGDAITTSDGSILSASPSKPPSHPPHSLPPSPSHPPHSPPPSPSQPTSDTRNADEGVWTTHRKPPPHLIPVTSPSRPAHLQSEARHQLPAPSSMAFSVPLSPERLKADGAQWHAFVRKRNKEQLESHAPSLGELRKVAPPSRKVAPPSNKVAQPSKKVTLPSKKVTLPSRKGAPPSRKVTSSPSHKSTAGPSHPDPCFLTTYKDTHLTNGQENPPHVGGYGGLGTCNTCGAYLFPGRLYRDEGGAPHLGKSASSSCQLCSKTQSHVAPTGHLPHKSDKPLTFLQTDDPCYSGPFPEPGAHKAPLRGTSEPGARHTSGLEPAARHTSGLKPGARHTSDLEPAARHTSGLEPAARHTSGLEPAARHTSGLEPAARHTSGFARHTSGLEPAARHTSGLEPAARHTSGLKPGARHTMASGLEPAARHTSGLKPGARHTMASGLEPAARHTSGLERRHSSELSLSSLSSCSVASDVLTRARERKDFWSSAAPPATE